MFVVWTEHSGLWFGQKHSLWFALNTQVCGSDSTRRFVVRTEHSGLWFGLNTQVCGLD